MDEEPCLYEPRAATYFDQAETCDEPAEVGADYCTTHGRMMEDEA